MSTADAYSEMQLSYRAIKEKMAAEGASLSVYGLILWAYENKHCKAYYKNSPWLLRNQIAQCVQLYCTEHEEEVIKFNKGVLYQQPALDF
jgi:hypothetical protein